MGELSCQDLRQLETLIRTEIGTAYDLVILPKLKSVDSKLDTALEGRDEHNRRLTSLELWRDGFHRRKTVRGDARAVVSVLLLTASLTLCLAAGLLLLWLIHS